MADIEIHEFIIESVGFLVEENEDSILLVMTYSEEDPNKINAPFIIPKCCIKERKLLSKGTTGD